MRISFLFVALTLVAALGCGRSQGHGVPCQECHPGCSKGLVTRCMVLTPPGCGSQPSQQFCPGGCTGPSPGECNFSSPDAASPESCAASSATIAAGALAERGADVPIAVTNFLAAETRVVIATSAAATCAAASGATGAPTAGSGALLTLRLPSGFAGTIDLATRGAALLTTWKDGAIVSDHVEATEGTMMLNLSQPNAGTIGSYDLVFPSGEEQGTFVAPLCDTCAR